MKELITDFIINGRENNPSEIIRKIVLFYYPGNLKKKKMFLTI
jgi:hypothetical protein